MKRRSDVIWLDLKESACTPLHGCIYKDKCARHIVLLRHDKGRPLADHSVVWSSGFVCGEFLDASMYRDAPDPGGRRVHPPIGAEA